jgi:hypothetical protein
MHKQQQQTSLAFLNSLIKEDFEMSGTKNASFCCQQTLKPVGMTEPCLLAGEWRMFGSFKVTFWTHCRYE